MSVRHLYQFLLSKRIKSDRIVDCFGGCFHSKGRIKDEERLLRVMIVGASEDNFVVVDEGEFPGSLRKDLFIVEYLENEHTVATENIRYFSKEIVDCIR